MIDDSRSCSTWLDCHQVALCAYQAAASSPQVLLELAPFNLESVFLFATLDLGLGCADRVWAAADVFLTALPSPGGEDQAEVHFLAAVT